MDTLGDQFANMAIWSIQADPNNINTIYIGNGLGQLLKSTDGGLSFSAPLLDKVGVLKGILINPNNSNEIFAALPSDGLYRSTNGGTTWTEVVTSGVEDVVYKPGTTSTVYATGNNFYRSTNSGATFTQITNGISISTRMKVAVTPANANYVYVVQRNGGQFGQLYRSTNSGTSFTIVADAASVGNLTGNQSGRDMAIAISDTDADEVHIGGLDMYESLDGGTSFTQEASWIVTNPQAYVHADIEIIQYINGNIFVGSDGGIYKSTNGGSSFVDLTTGMGIHQFYKIANAATNKDVIAGGSQDNGSVSTAGTAYQWQQWFGADGMDCMIDHTNEDIIYGGYHVAG